MRLFLNFSSRDILYNYSIWDTHTLAFLHLTSPSFFFFFLISYLNSAVPFIHFQQASYMSNQDSKIFLQTNRNIFSLREFPEHNMTLIAFRFLYRVRFLSNIHQICSFQFFLCEYETFPPGLYRVRRRNLLIRTGRRLHKSANSVY